MTQDGRDSARVVEVEKLVSGGLGLARDASGVIFLAEVMPGEKVLLGRQERRHGQRHAQVERWISPHPQRRPPPCPLHDRCGGCGFQFAPEELQREWKARWIQESLRRLGGLDLPLPTVRSGAAWSYRCRARFHRDEKGGIGFLERRSHRLVRVEHCPVLEPPLVALLDPGHLAWRHGRRDSLQALSDGSEAYVEGQGPARLRLNGLDLWVDPAAFFQTHRELTERLREEIERSLAPFGPAGLWDLYGGVGTWSQLLHHRGWEVTVVEANARSAALAQRNLPGARVIQARVEDFLVAQDQPPAWVIVDPPRGGLEPPALQELLRLRPPSLVFISCNADTLARDTRSLAAVGYRCLSLEVWDFFPQTFHAEVVSRWSLD